jgi:hypothetical protein
LSGGRQSVTLGRRGEQEGRGEKGATVSTREAEKYREMGRGFAETLVRYALYVIAAWFVFVLLFWLIFA